jgi:hypothetical protein
MYGRDLKLTLCGSISAVLAANWSLTGAGTVTAIAFPEKDWYDSQYASKPQITVSHLIDPPARYFALHGGSINMHSNPRYIVNLWVPILQGCKGTAEAQLIENMRHEVARIILANKNSIASFNPIVPENEGVPHHEINGTPAILRYEITLIGTHDSTA